MAMKLEERAEQFRIEVLEVGGTIYTRLMLERFIEKWSEPDRGKGKAQKMRFEKETTWSIKLRLGTWARNNFDHIPCFLTEEQKTIAVKKRALIEEMKPFRGIFTTVTLNNFYRFWSQPENVPGPKRLRWEMEKFWDLETRLTQWAEREQQQKLKNDERT